MLSVIIVFLSFEFDLCFVVVDCEWIFKVTLKERRVDDVRGSP